MRGRLLFVTGLALISAAGYSAPDLQVQRVITCNASGTAYTPVLSDAAYYVRVEWKVVGTGAKAYKVRFEIGDRSTDVTLTATSPGSYWAYAGFNMPTDGPIPAKVTLDPLKVSGDTTPNNNSGVLTFTPTMPSTGLQFYGPKTLKAVANTSLTWTGSGLKSLNVYTGAPTTDSSQTVTASTAPIGSTTKSSTPFGYPVYLNAYPARAAGSVAFSRSFTVSARSSRTNRDILNWVTWSQLNGLGSAYSIYKQPELDIQSSDSRIARFVGTILPSDYKTSMTPLQTARALFLGVAKYLTYDINATTSAVDTLRNRKGDCGGMSRLYVATLRYVGIPARMVAGWRQNAPGKNTAVTHAWTEFYFPDHGWIPQDVTDCNGYAPKGDQAYCFAIVPDLNARCIVQRGSTFTVNNQTVYGLVSCSYYYTSSGTVTFTAVNNSFSLKP